MSSVVAALEAHVICGRIPGLTARQREMCRSSPDAMVAVGDGVRLGTVECQEQFRHRRWNCSAIGSGSVFGHVVVVGEYLQQSHGITMVTFWYRQPLGITMVTFWYRQSNR
jgi:hypothetical protein